jgi:DNA-binding transcriptional MerR regulator
MLKIGDLSRLAQVSVKTLRYYSDLGLLKPEWIDRFTGYRYYAPEQLARLNRHLALRDLGFSLEQIGGLLSEWVTAEELRGMLRLRRAELEHSLNEERSRLSRVEARLCQIEREGRAMEFPVVQRSIEAQRVLAVHGAVAGFGRTSLVLKRLQTALRQVPPNSVEGHLIARYVQKGEEHGLRAEVGIQMVPGRAHRGGSEPRTVCTGRHLRRRLLPCARAIPRTHLEPTTHCYAGRQRAATGAPRRVSRCTCRVSAKGSRQGNGLLRCGCPS